MRLNRSYIVGYTEETVDCILPLPIPDAAPVTMAVCDVSFNQDAMLHAAKKMDMSPFTPFDVPFTPGCCVWPIFSKSDCPFRLSLYKLCANKGGVSHVKRKLVAICELRLISTLRIMIRDDCGS